MSGYITGMTVAEPLDGGELVEISQLSPTVRISAATISADEDDNSFNDSAAGFIAAGFAEGDRVNVTGFANALNNLFFGVISSLTASKMIIAGPEGDFIVDAAASPTITIAKWTTRRATAQDIANLGGGGGIAGIDVLEDGVAVQLDATVLNFTGAGVTVTDDGGYEVEVNIPGGGSGIRIEDEGTSTVASATAINFAGAGVTVTDAGGGEALVTIPGGGSSGIPDWTLAASWTYSTNVAQVDLTWGGSYTDLLIIARLVSTDAATNRNLRLSVDGGSTFFSTTGDYITVDGSGIEGSIAFLIQSNSTAQARTLICEIPGAGKSTLSPKVALSNVRPTTLFAGSASPINGVRLYLTSGTAVITGGTLQVYTR